MLKKHKHAAFNISNEQSVVHTEKHIKYRLSLIYVPVTCNLVVCSKLSQKYPCLCVRVIVFNSPIWNFWTHLCYIAITSTMLLCTQIKNTPFSSKLTQQETAYSTVLLYFPVPLQITWSHPQSGRDDLEDCLLLPLRKNTHCFSTLIATFQLVINVQEAFLVNSHLVQLN